MQLFFSFYLVFYNSTCFGRSLRPSSGVLQFILPRTHDTPVAATTVCNTPDDGRKLRPKHVVIKNQIKRKKLHLVGIYITSITKMHGTMDIKV